MKKRKSLVELGKILEKKVIECKKDIDSFKDNPNPQVKKILIESQAKLSVYEDILRYVENGSTWQF